MTDPSSDLRFHAKALSEYLLCWESAETRQRRGVSEGEAAYHLLENAGWLDRYGASSSWVDELRALPVEDRRRLVGAASRNAAGMTWAERARRLLSVEALSPEAFEEIEDLLIRRDALETVWSAARTLAADLLGSDAETGRRLAWLRCLAAEIDDELAPRPDVVSVAARVLNALPPPLPIPAELSTGWWYAGVRSLAAAYDAPVRFRRPVVTAPPRTVRFRVAETELAMAAAKKEEVWELRLVSDGDREVSVRVYPRDSAQQQYTLELAPVGPTEHAVLMLAPNEKTGVFGEQ
jgi:hypothetical protein